MVVKSMPPSSFKRSAANSAWVLACSIWSWFFEIIIVAGLEPLSQALGSDAASGFGQFVNDDMVRQPVVQHDVEHVASGFGTARDIRLQIALLRHLLLRGYGGRADSVFAGLPPSPGFGAAGRRDGC